MQTEAVTPSQVGARVGLSGQTIRREIEAGELKAFRTRGGYYRVPAKEADRYVARVTATSATSATRD